MPSHDASFGIVRRPMDRHGPGAGGFLVSGLPAFGVGPLTQEEHARHLGGLLANFQSLEFVLRAFLHALPKAGRMGVPYGTDIYLSQVGTELPENEFTNYDSLGDLIDCFNKEMKTRGLPEIDLKLVEVRNAIAHGRVSAPSQNETLRLIKFGKPLNKKVKVEFNEMLTKEWFICQKRRVCEAINLVHTHIV